MRFSPYKDENRSPQPLSISSTSQVQHNYEDEIWDSEDEEYPVFPEDPVDQWEVFELHSKDIVWKAAEAKAVEITHVRNLARRWIRNTATHAQSSSRIELSQIEDKLSSLQIKIQQEESRIIEDFGRRNKELWSGIEEAIEQAKQEEVKRLEAARRAEEIRKKAQEERRLDEQAAAHRKAEEEQEKAEKEKARIAYEEKARAEKLERDRIASEKLAAEKKHSGMTDSAKKEAEKCRLKLEDIKTSILKPVSCNNTWKAFCFDAKRKITPKLGQLTSSKKQINRVVPFFFALSWLIIEINDIENVFKNSKAVSQPVYQWTLNFFCKAALNQAETEVAVKPIAAYPLAFVCVALLADHPALPDIFFARLCKKCPWVIPWVQYDRATEEGRKRLGYNRYEDGKWEDAASYNERQSGIFALWSAVIQTPYPRNSFPIYYAWKFLSRLLNLIKDNCDGTACFLGSVFFDICGKQFVEVYGKQGRKLIECVVFGWIPTFTNGAKGVEASAAGRLLDIGHKYLQKNQIGIEDGGTFEA
ncbi:Nucleoporin gle1 [Neolecta irregularis DAH-3]|uniref:mRNA export factor GLE1 n=1 Tax=Neolecta irregularis (strain DAH-3) TaxID=1198029 RepID=A0A1U7LUG2_NEOID|nr:Nucleoporin gle1 [Neolecta irregularis DAH-3]|eukprot:OLL26284.1 Nucleoporin gle1 [Neolecta irregularis DAH-3]